MNEAGFLEAYQTICRQTGLMFETTGKVVKVVRRVDRPDASRVDTPSRRTHHRKRTEPLDAPSPPVPPVAESPTPEESEG